MTRYQRGDVILADYSYFDSVKGRFDFKPRPFVIVDVEEETDNISVMCSSQIHQSLNYKGIVVLQKSEEGKRMGLEEDSFIYLNKTIVLTNREIIRKIGYCPIIDEIITKLNS